MKACTKCTSLKGLIEFGKSSRAKDGLSSWCKKCTREASKVRNKERYERDPLFRKRLNTDRKERYTFDPPYVEAISKAVERHLLKNPMLPTWKAMINRCYNLDRNNYKNYGGRGIAVCEDWRDKGGYKKWYEYISKLPHFDEKGYTQDRINNDGNYEPGNMRWATRKEQNINKRHRNTK